MIVSSQDAMQTARSFEVPETVARHRTGVRAGKWGAMQGAVVSAAAAALLAGCSVLPATPEVITYDLGPAAAPAPAAAMPANAPLRLRVLPTDGPARLEGNAIFYRLNYAQPQRLQPYATQRWIESPVRLVDERLRDAVSRQAALTGRAGSADATLRAELLDFEQIFDSTDTSRALVRVRATLSGSGEPQQRVFAAERAAPTPDGAGGVQALAAGTDEVIAQMLQWAATAARDTGWTQGSKPGSSSNRP